MTVEKKKILAATSISPVNINNQRMAINTWLRAGFDVVSLNNEAETNELAPLFPDIQFHVVNRNAKEKFGKPYIYIYDFMCFLNSTDYKICGIINSDIYFKRIKKNFLNFIYRKSLESLVYGHRIDVDNINELNGEVCEGIDYFFFDRKLINIYTDDGLCMGQPAWDYWMVAVPASKHIKTKRILNQIAYHQKHPQQWDKELNHNLTNNIIIEKYIKKLHPDYTISQLTMKLSEIVCLRDGIVYNDIKNKPTVLVVYDPTNCKNIYNSKTYNSIKSQSYQNLRIYIGNINNIQRDGIKEDYIYFIKEGYHIDQHFIELLINEIEGFDCIIVNSEKLNIFEEKNNLDTLHTFFQGLNNHIPIEKALFRVVKLNNINFDLSKLSTLNKKLYGFRNLYDLKTN